MSKRSVVVGLGSNIDSIQNLRLALEALKKVSHARVVQVAKIYESDALLPENSDASWNKKYLNSAVLLEAEDFDAERFLNQIKKIEQDLGRKNSERWSPRVIDLDILWVNDLNFSSEKLTVPHRELLKRPFALMPLLDLVPDLDMHRPDWLQQKTKPFNTIVSREYVWPKIVGILNVTSDSFSDGGIVNRKMISADESDEKINEDLLFERIEKLISDGADIIDIGAESTRPGAVLIDASVEYNRLAQVLKLINEFKQQTKNKFAISIDCRKPEVVKKVIENYSIDYLNDVEGFRDEKMMRVAQHLLQKNINAKLVCMHSMSVPPIKSESIPTEQDVFVALTQWWTSKVREFEQYKIENNRCIFDVGIGFAKTPEQSFALLKNLNKLNEIKNEIYIGHSRKSFLGLITDRPAEQRDEATALITRQINQAYSQYLRVHNVQINKEALSI